MFLNYHKYFCTSKYQSRLNKSLRKNTYDSTIILQNPRKRDKLHILILYLLAYVFHWKIAVKTLFIIAVFWNTEAKFNIIFIVICLSIQHKSHVLNLSQARCSGSTLLMLHHHIANVNHLVTFLLMIHLHIAVVTNLVSFISKIYLHVVDVNRLV